MGAREQVAGKRMGAIAFDWNLDEFERIRKSEGMVEYLTEVGTQLVSELNAELHAAQATRKQPIADGYKFYVTDGAESSRARLHIIAFTARGIAHEAVHQSILKKLGQTAATTTAGRSAEKALARAGRDAARGSRRDDHRRQRGDKALDEWIRQREDEAET